MNLSEKLLCFDYFITQLICRYYCKGNSTNCSAIIKDSLPTSELSKLKLMKLLFFATVVNKKNWYLLDKVFDNFHALPYGPVESTLYDNLNSVPNYEITSSVISLKMNGPGFKYNNIDINAKKSIDEAFDCMSQKCPTIFKKSAFELVELSHMNDSWKIAINEARMNDSFSRKMSHTLIKESRIILR